MKPSEIGSTNCGQLSGQWDIALCAVCTSMCSWNMPTVPHLSTAPVLPCTSIFYLTVYPFTLQLYNAFSFHPFPLLTTNFHPLSVGPPQRLEDSRPKHGTHPPSHIPIRDRTCTLNRNQIFSCHETHPPSSIPAQHGTHPPSRIPIRDRTHPLSHTQFPSRHGAPLPIQSPTHGHSSSHGPRPQELSRPLPLPIREPKSQTTHTPPVPPELSTS